jgi:hypothetical protein
VDAASFDLAQVGKELREELIRATDEAARAGQQLRVGESLDRDDVRKGTNGVDVRLHTEHGNPEFSKPRIGALARD